MKHRNLFLRLYENEDASVIILVALATFMLIITIGVAVDMARAQAVQSRMSYALDAAALAVGANGTMCQGACATSLAQKYFNADFPPGYLGINGTPQVTVNINTVNTVTTISLGTQGIENTVFLPVVHIPTVKIAAASQVTRSISGMEVAMTVDNTDSMNDPVSDGNGGTTTKLAAAKQATCLLVTALYGGNGDPNNYCNPPQSQTVIPGLWIGIVPYTAMVNVGPGRYVQGLKNPWDNPHNWIDWTIADPNFKTEWTGKGPDNTWQGCVTSRLTTAMPLPYQTPSPNNYDDNNLAPVKSDMNTYFGSFYNEKPEDGINHNFYCPTPLTQMIGAQAGDEQTLLTHINAMANPAGGGSAIGLGLAWTARLLSPNWQSRWGGEMDADGLPLAWNTPGNSKVVILLSDGLNDFESNNLVKNAYGWFNDHNIGNYNPGDCPYAIPAGQPLPKPANKCALNARTKDVTDNYLKNNGVTVYTVGFGDVNKNEINVPLLGYLAGPPGSSGQTQTCSLTGPYCFLASDQKTLMQAFQIIGQQLVSLRVSQ